MAESCTSQSFTDEDVESLEDKLKELTENDIEQRFLETLDDMNIAEDKREPLLQKTFAEKQGMIIIYLKECRNNSRCHQPTEYIEYLQDRKYNELEIYQCIASLRVALTSNTISWMKKFGVQGFDEIVRLLKRCQFGYYRVDFETRSVCNIEFECIRCLKAFMNNTWGLNLVIKPDQHPVILLLAHSIDRRNPQTMYEALKLLNNLCILYGRTGYVKVMAVLNADRYRAIVEGLFLSKKSEPHIDVCLQSLMFINTITNTSPDIHTRLHLRCEIERMGLSEQKVQILLNIVEKSNNAQLKEQFKIFKKANEDDIDEFESFDQVYIDFGDCQMILLKIANSRDKDTCGFD